MAKTVVDPVLLLLTERNIQLETELSAARRTIEDQRKELATLHTSVSRPAIATMTEGQIQLLAHLLLESMEVTLTEKRATVN